MIRTSKEALSSGVTEHFIPLQLASIKTWETTSSVVKLFIKRGKYRCYLIHLRQADTQLKKKRLFLNFIKIFYILTDSCGMVLCTWGRNICTLRK